MRSKRELTTISKYMSYLLRHKPEDAGLILNKEGWCELDQLVANADFDLQDVLNVVSSDEKNRFKINEVDGRKFIRANQGHSTSVSIDFRKADPPATLYHGTTVTALPSILKSGLLPMNRHHVHLSVDIETARKVGDRRKAETVILKIDARAMVQDGSTFFISDNGIWLVDAVPSRYLAPL